MLNARKTLSVSPGQVADGMNGIHSIQEESEGFEDDSLQMRGSRLSQSGEHHWEHGPSTLSPILGMENGRQLSRMSLASGHSFMGETHDGEDPFMSIMASLSAADAGELRQSISQDYGNFSVKKRCLLLEKVEKKP